MDLSLIINFVIAYGACQAFFIAFILPYRPPVLLFKRLFGLFLIIEGITLLERFLVEADLITSIPHLLGIAYPISFIKPPLLFFMALALTNHHFKLEKRHFLHFLPFVGVLIFNLPFYFMEGPQKLEMVTRFMESTPSYRSFDFYLSLGMFVYIGGYIAAAFLKLNRYRQHIKNNSLVNWYWGILMLYSGFLLLHLIYYAIQPIGPYRAPFFNQLSMLAMTFIIQAIAYKLIVKSGILESKPAALGDPEKRSQTEQAIMQRLQVDKAYLDDTLNLKSFSKALDISPAVVSEIINQKFNCSFKRLLAQYRLREAKAILQQQAHTQVKLIDVAYDAGFGNKVSFYRTFKQFEGISPSEYLKQLVQDQRAS